MDLVITGGTVITMDPERRILDRGAVAIQGERIVAVGPADALGPPRPATRTIDATGKVVLPGLVNTHTHLFQTLLKGPNSRQSASKTFLVTPE